MLLFKERHVPMIRRGIKTATRREWKDTKARPNVGAVHIAATSRYTRREEAAAYIEIEDVYEEPLGDMTDEDYDAEGGYSEATFKDIWRELHGGYDPADVVDVVEFRYVTSPRELALGRAKAERLAAYLEGVMDCPKCYYVDEDGHEWRTTFTDEDAFRAHYTEQHLYAPTPDWIVERARSRIGIYDG